MLSARLSSYPFFRRIIVFLVNVTTSEDSSSSLWMMTEPFGGMNHRNRKSEQPAKKRSLNREKKGTTTVIADARDSKIATANTANQTRGVFCKLVGGLRQRMHFSTKKRELTNCNVTPILQSQFVMKSAVCGLQPLIIFKSNLP